MLNKIKTLKWPERALPGPLRYLLDALLVALCAIPLSAWLNLCYPIPVPLETHLRVALEVPG